MYEFSQYKENHEQNYHLIEILDTNMNLKRPQL